MNDNTPKNIDGWCILRCAGASTLRLAASLNEAGIEAWTPIGKVMRRQGRNRNMVKVPAPIMPTFVFARYNHVPELRACAISLTKRHPGFSVFRYLGAVPSISHAALESIRTEERRQTPRSFPKGANVTMPNGSFAGPWTGLTGVIERVEGPYLVAWFMLFGRSVEVKIPTCELPDDAIDTGSSTKDVAARAA